MHDHEFQMLMDRIESIDVKIDHAHECLEQVKILVQTHDKDIYLAKTLAKISTFLITTVIAGIGTWLGIKE
jgi:hypothetical protein